MKSLSITRERIHTTHPLQGICKGMIKVAAKRACELDLHDFIKFLTSFEGGAFEVRPPIPLPFRNPDVLVGSMAPRDSIPRHLTSLLYMASGRTRVSAMLTDAVGRVLAISWSRTHSNRAAHAELELVQNLYADGFTRFPDHSTLWISLRPCAMCAAQILAFMDGSEGFKIRFLADDPGPASKNSCLFEGSALWRSSGCPKVDIALVDN